LQLPKPAAISSRGCETLLLVEDEVAVRQSTREFLMLNGYIVLEAKNGEDALCIVREYTPPIHMMITDVVMPTMGGAKLAAHLAVERPDMKVLFVSGYAENTVLRHGAIDVANRFLQKPFSLKTLARKIREILEAETAIAASAGAS
jgi:DNA-binding NtrC family response regulator